MRADRLLAYLPSPPTNGIGIGPLRLHPGCHRRSVEHGRGCDDRDGRVEHDGGRHRLGGQDVYLPGQDGHNEHQTTKIEDADAVGQACHRGKDTTPILFGHTSEGTRQRTADWMGNRSGQPPVPVAGGVQLSTLDSSQIRFYSRRRGLDKNIEQKAVVDDEQEVWSALDYVRVLDDASLGGFLVRSRGGVVQKGGAYSFGKVPMGPPGQCQLARSLRFGSYLRSQGAKVIHGDGHKHRVPVR